MYIASGIRNGRVWAYAVNSIAVVGSDFLLELSTDDVFKYVFVPKQSIHFDTVGAFFRRYSDLVDFFHVEGSTYCVEFWTEDGEYCGCTAGGMKGCVDSYLKKINS